MEHMPFIVIAVFFILGTAFLVHRMRKKDEDEDFYLEDEKPVSLNKIGFQTNTEISSERDLEEYMVAYTEEHFEKAKLGPVTEREVFNFFVKSFESIRLNYVFETGRVLVANNLPAVFLSAAKNIWRKRKNRI